MGGPGQRRRGDPAMQRQRALLSADRRALGRSLAGAVAPVLKFDANARANLRSLVRLIADRRAAIAADDQRRIALEFFVVATNRLDEDRKLAAMEELIEALGTLVAEDGNEVDLIDEYLRHHYTLAICAEVVGMDPKSLEKRRSRRELGPPPPLMLGMPIASKRMRRRQK